MADPKGFLTFKRELPSSREVNVRLSDYKEIYDEFPVEKTKQQAARCMDCGVPFCHSGCPLGNEFLNLMTLFIGKNGKRHSRFYRKPIISLNLQGVFVRLLAKRRVSLV